MTKNLDEILSEWDELIKVSTKLELRDWLRTTLTQYHQELQEARKEYQPINIQGLHTKNNKLYALVELPAQDSQLFIKPLSNH